MEYLDMRLIFFLPNTAMPYCRGNDSFFCKKDYRSEPRSRYLLPWNFSLFYSVHPDIWRNISYATNVVK